MFFIVDKLKSGPHFFALSTEINNNMQPYDLSTSAAADDVIKNTWEKILFSYFICGPLPLLSWNNLLSEFCSTLKIFFLNEFQSFLEKIKMPSLYFWLNQFVWKILLFFLLINLKLKLQFWSYQNILLIPKSHIKFFCGVG